MKYLTIFLVFLNFCIFAKAIKIYKVITERFSDNPLIDNNGFIYASSPTMFCYNGTIGSIMASRQNGNYIFISSTFTLLPNGSYSAEPLQQKNILPLSLNFSIYYPSVSFFNGTYYLLYNEINEDTYETLFAIAKSDTPLMAQSWLKLKNLPLNFFIAYSTEAAVILWNGPKNADYLFFGYLSGGPAGIDFIQDNTSLLSWTSPGKVNNLIEPRPGFFDGKQIQPGASPIQLKCGDYLFLYNGENKSVSLGYLILNESNASQVLQRSDKPIMEPEFSWEMNSINSNGLIKDPNGCPATAAAEIGPEYAKNVECFLGVYSGYRKNVSIFRVFVGWKNSVATTTPEPIKSTSKITFTSPLTTTATTTTTTTEYDKTSSQIFPESTIPSTQPSTTDVQKSTSLKSSGTTLNSTTPTTTKSTITTPTTSTQTPTSTQTMTTKTDQSSSFQTSDVQNTTIFITTITAETSQNNITSYYQTISTTLQTPSTTESPSKTVLIIILTSASLLLIIFAAVIIIFCYKRIKKRRSLVGIIVKQHEMSDKEAKNLAKAADRFQLNSNKISVNYEEIIGRGSTATVYKGFLHGTSALSSETANNKLALKQKYANCKVAIKIPKEMSRNESEQIMRELQAMRQIGYHGHISVLLGWCFQNDLPSLIFELAQQDLFKYIRKFREPPDSCMPLKQMLSVGWQISVGMQHVASFNMVHRDLAARNILLYDGFHAKISDFGLCCHCDESFTYQASLNKKLPVRWLSIEALTDRRFSEKSDVWAFGVLLYEMCTNGSVPYTALSNYDVLKFLESGKRLEKPETADRKLYDLMIDCWKESISERLSFADVTLRLQNQLEEETQTYGYLSLASEDNEMLYS